MERKRISELSRLTKDLSTQVDLGRKEPSAALITLLGAGLLPEGLLAPIWLSLSGRVWDLLPTLLIWDFALLLETYEGVDEVAELARDTGNTVVVSSSVLSRLKQSDDERAKAALRVIGTQIVENNPSFCLDTSLTGFPGIKDPYPDTLLTLASRLSDLHPNVKVITTDKDLFESAPLGEYRVVLSSDETSSPNRLGARFLSRFTGLKDSECKPPCDGLEIEYDCSFSQRDQKWHATATLGEKVGEGESYVSEADARSYATNALLAQKAPGVPGERRLFDPKKGKNLVMHFISIGEARPGAVRVEHVQKEGSNVFLATLTVPGFGRYVSDPQPTKTAADVSAYAKFATDLVVRNHLVVPVAFL